MVGFVLKVNNGGLPIDIVPWQSAICDWVTGKAEIITYYEDKKLHSGFGNNFIDPVYNSKIDDWEQVMNMPAVIRISSFTKPKGVFKAFKSFNRKNIYKRDDGKCQYCNNHVSFNSFQLEHVIPRSCGGKLNWKNIVVSCPKCNNKKRNRTPEEAGMKLIRKPFAPVVANDYNESIFKKFKSMKKIKDVDEWKDWIYWTVN